MSAVWGSGGYMAAEVGALLLMLAGGSLCGKCGGGCWYVERIAL